MRNFLRDIFHILLDGIKVKNIVMSAFVDSCILKVLRNCSTYRSCIPILANELNTSKNKFVRERVLQYLNDILVYWDVSDKEADLIADSIRIGLEDASINAREISRFAYLHLFQLFPRKCERIKTNASPGLRNRLQHEEEHLFTGNQSETPAPILSKVDNKSKSPSVVRVKSAMKTVIPKATEKSYPKLQTVEAIHPSAFEVFTTSVETQCRVSPMITVSDELTSSLARKVDIKESVPSSSIDIAPVTQVINEPVRRMTRRSTMLQRESLVHRTLPSSPVSAPTTIASNVDSLPPMQPVLESIQSTTNLRKETLQAIEEDSNDDAMVNEIKSAVSYSPKNTDSYDIFDHTTVPIFPISKDLLLLESLGQVDNDNDNDDSNAAAQQSDCKGRNSRLTVFLRAPRMNVIDSAAVSIQAFVRGGLVRRSVLGPFAGNQGRRSSWLGPTSLVTEESPVRESLVPSGVETTSSTVVDPVNRHDTTITNELNISTDTDQSSCSIQQGSFSEDTDLNSAQDIHTESEKNQSAKSLLGLSDDNDNENFNPNANENAIDSDLNESQFDKVLVAHTSSSVKVRRSHRQSTLHYFNSFTSPVLQEGQQVDRDSGCYDSLDTSPAFPPLPTSLPLLSLTAVAQSSHSTISDENESKCLHQPLSMSLAAILKNKVAHSMKILRDQLTVLEQLESENESEPIRNGCFSDPAIVKSLLESIDKERLSLDEFHSSLLNISNEVDFNH